jgi:hypothetical protein
MNGAIEGPINPTNYSGTQINIWGFPPTDIAGLTDAAGLNPKPQNLGYMTEDMIKVVLKFQNTLIT